MNTDQNTRHIYKTEDIDWNGLKAAGISKKQLEVQLCYFQIFDIIELYTDTIRVIALQHLLPTGQIIACLLYTSRCV